MVFMQQRHLQQVSRCDIYITACKILVFLFCIWTSYILLSDYLMLILKFYTVPVRLHNMKRFLNHKNTFKQTC